MVERSARYRCEEAHSMESGKNGPAKELSERKKQILKAIIEAHIELGEPVGSKYLTSNKHIACSSATIRNEMAELEAMGYLEQPHTSAGRVPSEAGYRLYVDSLIDRYRLTEREIEELRTSLRKKQSELDGILDTAIRLASSMTDYTALAAKPRKVRVTVSHFEIIRTDDYSMLLVMLIGNIVKTRRIRSRVAVPSETAAHLETLLNARLTGLSAKEITMPLMMEIEREMGDDDFLVAPVVKGICETISAFDGGELRFDGIDRLLSYPEVYGGDRLREMLTMFERKSDLLDVFSESEMSAGADGGVRIYIGRENLVRTMDNSTLVYKPIKRGDTLVGAIGVIGPTRMNYSRVIAMIDHLSSGVSRLIEEGDGGDEEG
ncbi:MAG: heat-inducible transcription repressor HrcA [Clostridia bacterium]|nr:heat-inducible transcription repressor HrcA [Clostridia bacterium]